MWRVESSINNNDNATVFTPMHEICNRDREIEVVHSSETAKVKPATKGLIFHVNREKTWKIKRRIWVSMAPFRQKMQIKH